MNSAKTDTSLMDFVKRTIGESGVPQRVLENGVKIIDEVLQSSEKNVVSLEDHPRGSELNLCFENDRHLLYVSINSRNITLGRKGCSSSTITLSVESIDDVIAVIKERFNE